MKIVKKTSATIWCEVVCQKCGGTVGLHYKNKSTISAIKKATKGWKTVDLEDGSTYQLCPECIEHIKNERME